MLCWSATEGARASATSVCACSCAGRIIPLEVRGVRGAMEGNVDDRLGATNDMKFEPPGPGPWAADAVHFPRPATRYWAETHPAAMRRGTQRLRAASTGCSSTRLEMQYVNGIGYNQMQPAPDEEIPQRFAARRGGHDRQALAGAAPRVGRDRQAVVDREHTARSRRSIPTRSPTRSWRTTSRGVVTITRR